MHPILLRIPLPQFPLKLWWGLTVVAVLAFAFAAWALKTRDKGGAITGAVVGAAAAIGAFVGRGVAFEAESLPLYSYGVMLGLSLVVGWYLTLTLAERDGLPKETMANCYVITAVAAIVGSRVLYVATNLDEFHSIADAFKVRLGGLVAYGGFLGGYLGSWVYLRTKSIRLMPWADVAVPSLASGLMITRIGCYLFGCDFGKPLADDAPELLKRIGTFPHWATGTVENGDGSPAYLRHLELFKGTPLGEVITKTNASLPVHPTQIYESLVGLLLLTALLLQRRTQKFRGQIFFLFVFGYGYLRFLLEILRDDVERGEYGPTLPIHLLVPGALFLMSLGYVFGISLGIGNKSVRLATRVAAFVPPVVAWVLLKPASFGASVSTQLSTSQWIGFLTALAVSAFYALYAEEARKQPRGAMSRETLGPGAAIELAKEAGEENEAGSPGGDEDESEKEEGESGEIDEAALTVTKAEAPRPKKEREQERERTSGKDEAAPESDTAGKPAPQG